MATEQRIDNRLQSVCLVILTAIALAAALHWLSPVIIPFILALMITYVLIPVAELLMRYIKMPRWAALIGAMLLGVLGLTLMGFMISISVNQLTDNADAYAGEFKRLYEMVIPSQADLEALRALEEPTLMEQIKTVIGEKSIEYREGFDERFGEPIKGILTGIASGVLNVLSNGLLVLVFMIFLLLGASPTKEKRPGLRGEIESRVKRYISTMVVVSSVTGILTWLILAILGVDMALVFGLLAFLLNFIPNVGSVIAVGLPLPIVLLDPDKTLLIKCLAFVLPMIVQFVIGNIVAPKMMGQSLDLHPITILMALIFFGMLWGIMGMFLATPITAVIKILCEQIEVTRPFALLMAGEVDKAEKAFREG